MELLKPANDVRNPSVSIVIPAANEEITIVKFIEWCRAGLEKSKMVGEVLIISSSTDRTSELALENGARVLNSPKLGLGRAYIDAIPFIRGDFIILGDADCTYDFREINLFINEFQKGREFIMGSRFIGKIEKKSMPLLHQYIGTPLTTWMLNRIFHTSYTDIHCGMRGITLDSLKSLNLKSQSWEYASEMIIKAKKHNLVTSEVPVNFYKDIEGRLSHHKRSGWLSPFKAAWINIKSMLIYGFDYLTFKPGVFLFYTGLSFLLYTSIFNISFLNITFSIASQIIFSMLSLAGLQLIYLSFVPKILFDFKLKFKMPKYLNLNISGYLSLISFIVGVLLLMNYFISVVYEFYPDYVNNFSKYPVLGIYLTFLSLSLFFNSIMLNSVHVDRNNE